MADQSMDDDELRAELEEFHETVSKINDKTRPIYIKKLNHLRARQVMANKSCDLQQKKRSSGRPSSRHSSSSYLPVKRSVKVENDEDEEDSNHSKAFYTDERHLRRRTININLPLLPSRSSTTTGVSNGDHEDEEERSPRHGTRTPPGGQIRKSSFTTSTPVTNSSRSTGQYDVELPTNRTFPPQLSFSNTLTNSRPVSGESTAGRTPPRAGFLGKLMGKGNREPPESSRPVTRGYANRSLTEFSDSEGEIMPDTSTKAINTSFPYSDDSMTGYPNPRVPTRSTPMFWSSSRYRPTGRSDPKPSRLFPTSGNLESGRLWSNVISKIVLVGVTAFFALVAIVYFYKAFLVSPPPTGHIAEGPLCIKSVDGTDEVCLNEKERNALDDVIILLAKRSGEVACHILRPESPAGFVTVTELINRLQKKYDDVGVSSSYDVNIESLISLIRSRSDWNISLACRTSSDPSSPIGYNCNEARFKDIVSLRSERLMLPLTCRIKRALHLVTFNIFMIFLGILSLAASIWFALWLRRRRDKMAREINSRANEIVGLLQNHASQCQKDPAVKPYLPVSHIRDALIPLSDRAKKRHVWNEAVKHLAENETRILQDVQSIAGEEMIVWKWNELTSVDLFGGKTSATSSSADLPSSTTTKTTTSTTTSTTPERKRLNLLPFDSKGVSPCLKVYNIITNHGPDNYISEKMRDAVLDKCGQYHGILHIGCDYNIEEGVMFVKCVSEAAANQNYKALHGWTYGDQLVSVKYVSPLVYKMTFIDSDNAMVPLKSTTHRRRPAYGNYDFYS